MSFNVYTEARDYFEQLLGSYNGDDSDEITLQELHDELRDSVEYSYSVYNSSLFEAISEDLTLLGYAQDVEQEFGVGIATNPLMINVAIEQYILETYGDKTADYFDIEVAV
jgi:hypothetical protein